jgi:type II secretory pathway component PulK
MAKQLRSGFTLIVVLVVVAFMSLGAYAFSELMLAEYRGTIAATRTTQARALADSGLEVILATLAEDRQVLMDQGGLYDNETFFRGLMAVDDETAQGRGRIAIVAPQMDADGYYEGIRFGLEDESTRLNINTLLLADQYTDDGGRTLLMGLPGMTEDIADAILDWIDPDDEPREFGAEQDVYAGLDPPYMPKNGILDSVEELLLVRGVTPALLYGADANRNGVIEQNEQAGLAASGFDPGDGSLDRGWAAYLTLHSAEANLSPDGLPKIHLNQDDMATLYDELSAVFDEEWATFIVAFRQNGAYRGGRTGTTKLDGAIDLTQPGRRPISSVLDLIGAKTRVRVEGEDEAVVLESPFPNIPLAMNVYLPALLDYVAVNPAPIIPGRININQAPRAILLGIPGMTEEIVDEIIAQRNVEPDIDQPHRRHETWLMAEELVTLEEMRELYPFITGRGSVYRAQIVGYYEGGGTAARIEAVVDASSGVPRVVLWRDLSHLGRGYSVETLGIAAP